MLLSLTQTEGHAHCISLNNELQEAGLSLSSTASLPPSPSASFPLPVCVSVYNVAS